LTNPKIMALPDRHISDQLSNFQELFKYINALAKFWQLKNWFKFVFYHQNRVKRPTNELHWYYKLFIARI